MFSNVELSKIVADDSWNCRFAPGEIDELADDIKKNGLINPLQVHDNGDGTFQLIAGFRRYKALQKIGATEAPVTIYRGLSESARRMINISENLQRQSLSPIEEAEAIVRLFPSEVSPEEVATALNKSVSWVYGRLSLLKLSPELRAAVHEGTLPVYKAQKVAQKPKHEQVIEREQVDSVRKRSKIEILRKLEQLRDKYGDGPWSVIFEWALGQKSDQELERIFENASLAGH